MKVITNVDEFLKMLDPKFQDQLRADAKRVVAMIASSPDVPEEIRIILGRAKFIHDLPTGREREKALQNSSTGMFPLFDTPWIICGTAGSVWHDCIISGKKCRIGINPKATVAKDAYYIEVME